MAKRAFDTRAAAEAYCDEYDIPHDAIEQVGVAWAVDDEAFSEGVYQRVDDESFFGGTGSGDEGPDVPHVHETGEIVTTDLPEAPQPVEPDTSVGLPPVLPNAATEFTTTVENVPGEGPNTFSHEAMDKS